jgi:hypothetical protein
VLRAPAILYCALRRRRESKSFTDWGVMIFIRIVITLYLFV